MQSTSVAALLSIPFSADYIINIAGSKFPTRKGATHIDSAGIDCITFSLGGNFGQFYAGEYTIFSVLDSPNQLTQTSIRSALAWVANKSPLIEEIEAKNDRG